MKVSECLLLELQEVFFSWVVNHPHHVWNAYAKLFLMMRLTFCFLRRLFARSSILAWSFLQRALRVCASIWRISCRCFDRSLSKTVFFGLPHDVPSLNPLILKLRTVEWAQLACLPISRRESLQRRPCLIIWSCLYVKVWPVGILEKSFVW